MPGRLAFSGGLMPNLFRLCLRVLGQLGPEARVGWLLVLAGPGLAVAQFAEPVLFGRIIDALARAQAAGASPGRADLPPLLGAWAAFGLFTIVCGALAALNADRLAHGRRHAVLTDYFEHILQLPLSYHGGMHSGRLLKVMLAGTDSLWWLWLADLTLVAQPGDTIALVGATSAGKSTAAALLHRVFDPQSGAVRIDGVDIRDLTLAALRRNIGVVFQESLLFNRSIGENLLVGKPDATMDELRAAAARAQALDFIERNGNGFAASVGERGRLLSGGEGQRLAIARALLKDPPILILDEATSALDAATEARLQAALDEVMKGRTTFIIAHRLATVRKATRILVLESGRVIESGAFDDLVARSGRFAALAATQLIVAEA